MEKESTPERPSGQTYDLSGMFSLALRLVVGCKNRKTSCSSFTKQNVSLLLLLTQNEM